MRCSDVPTSAAKIIAASFGLGVAAWLLPSSIDIVSWPRGGIDRVALVAPLYLFWAALAASAVLAGLLWLAGGREPGARARRAHAVAPASALWLWTLPFLPWLGDRFPLLLILAGPLRWPIAAAALGAVVHRLWDPALAAPLRWLISRRRHTPVFVLSLALYLVLGLRSLSVMGLGGDEPHYLVITHSLLVDHDLKIENNHVRGDYHAFFGGDLRPDYLQRGANGEIYSIHAPGLPALLLPGYAMLGSRGAVATVCLMAALAALAIFDVAMIVGGPVVAWATWACVCLTVPFIPHAWSMYPEIAAASIVAWVVVWVLQEGEASVWAWLGRGLCLAMLPWLHTKFIVILAAAAVWLLVERRRRVKATLALLTPIALSVAAWFAFFYIIYGTPNPQAPYGAHAEQFVRFENLPRSALGLLFDQKFGLFVYAPVYVAAAVGWWILLRNGSRRAFAAGLVGVVLLFSASSARYYMWWGGLSAPARFLVPVVPLFAPMIAAAFAEARGATARALLWTLGAASVLVAAVGVVGPDRLLLFSDPHGTARLLQLVQGSVPLTAALPSFTDDNWQTPLVRLWPWAGAAVAGLVATIVTARRSRSRLWLTVAGGTIFLAVAAAAAGPIPVEARAESVTRGRLALADRFDPERLRAFDYETHSKMSPAQWMGASAIAIDLDPVQPADGYGRLGGPVTIAPGRYVLKVWFKGSRAVDGDLLLAFDSGQVLRHVAGPLSNPAMVAIDVPVAIPQLWVRLTDLASAQQALRVELTPTSIVPASERPAVDAHAVESIPGRPGAYLVYADDQTFPEGGVFWTKGTRLGEVLIVPAGAREVLLTLHVGPVGGAVRVVTGRREDVTMAPEETRTISIRMPEGSSSEYLAVGIKAPGAFRPADVNPNSSDTRSLGCQVRVEVR